MSISISSSATAIEGPGPSSSPSDRRPEVDNIGEGMSVSISSSAIANEGPGPSSSPSEANYFQEGEGYLGLGPWGNMRMMNNNSKSSSWGGVSEIEEEHSSELFEINSSGSGVQGLDTIREEALEGSSLFSFDFHNGEGQDAVYVAVGNEKGTGRDQESSSMDALIWTLNHAVNDPSSTIVFLIHVFPEIKNIPTPLGMMPVSQVNPVQKENYMAQERGKRREFLHKFLNACSAAQVKVDTILIESDMEAKAILDLIRILNIRKLVLGTSKANLRKMKSRRASGTIDQILKGAPEFCEVKIICEGKEALDLSTESPSPSPRAYNLSPQPEPIQDIQDHVASDYFRCGCFKLKG